MFDYLIMFSPFQAKGTRTIRTLRPLKNQEMAHEYTGVERNF